jgi:hypothetical protein
MPRTPSPLTRRLKLNLKRKMTTPTRSRRSDLYSLEIAFTQRKTRCLSSQCKEIDSSFTLKSLVCESNELQLPIFEQIHHLWRLPLGEA